MANSKKSFYGNHSGVTLANNYLEKMFSNPYKITERQLEDVSYSYNVSIDKLKILVDSLKKNYDVYLKNKEERNKRIEKLKNLDIKHSKKYNNKAALDAIRNRIIENKNKSLNMYKDGYSFEEISKKLNISIRTVYNYINKKAIMIEKIKQLNKEGKKDKEIAVLIGCTRQNVNYIINKYRK